MNLNINFMSTFFGIITNFFNCMTINNCKKQITDMKVKIYCINEVLKLLKTESVAKADNPLKTGFVSVESKAGNYVKRGSALRHITLFAALALGVAAMPALTSCEKEKSINSGVQSGEKITLIATVEQPGDAQAGSSQVGNTTGTKTSLGELSGGTNPVNWSARDAIKVFATSSGTYETTGAEFTTVGTGKKVDFTGTLASGAAPLLAYYPASGISSITSAGEMTVTLPATQTYKANSFGKDANPAVAYSASGTDLVFKNLCGMVKLNLYSETTLKVRSISLMNSTEKLSGAGTVTVNIGTGIPALTMKTDLTASNYVKLDCGETGVTLSTDSNSPTVCDIVVPPSTGTIYGYQVSVQFTDGTTVTGYMSKSATIKAENKIERSKYRKMPTFAAAISANDYIYKSFDYGAGTTIGSTTWAPVNCGYDATNYKYGKLYQWGRKDGQGWGAGTGADATYPSGANIVTGPVDLTAGQNADNAEKFYKNSSSPYDWLSPKNDALWNSGTEAAPVKTLYDPCPTGWRIPTMTELYALMGSTEGKGKWDDEKKGRWFDGTTNTDQTSGVFLPAAGYRVNDGNADVRGSYGLYWSSTPSDDRAYGLSFSHTMASTSYNKRAYGFSVRCVRE